ncbi:MAG: hypothetical protein OQK24_03565 [Magnetovibrio sp.]|nr:hypothetical protein [Magnetovibrio sp.]
MTSNTTLYAWARPLDIDPKLDHTWVTDYQPASQYADIQAVMAANKNYWFCWGSFHDDDYRGIGDDGADFTLASCLVTPNDANAHGTIFRYAIDGVCHQLANQVLYSTDSKITVSKAHGYRLSSFLYGTYGRQDAAWNQKIATCTSTKQVGIMDDLKSAMVSILGQRATPEKIDALNTLRHEFQQSIQNMGRELFTENSNAGADAINAKITEFTLKAREILGDEDFKAMFDMDIADSYKLVDPEMFAQSEASFAQKAKDQSED